MGPPSGKCAGECWEGVGANPPPSLGHPDGPVSPPPRPLLQLCGQPRLQAPVPEDERPVSEAARHGGEPWQRVGAATTLSWERGRPVAVWGQPGLASCPPPLTLTALVAEVPHLAVQRRRGHGLQLPRGRVVCGLPAPEGEPCWGPAWHSFALPHPHLPRVPGRLCGPQRAGGWAGEEGGRGNHLLLSGRPHRDHIQQAPSVPFL